MNKLFAKYHVEFMTNINIIIVLIILMCGISLIAIHFFIEWRHSFKKIKFYKTEQMDYGLFWR